MLQPRPGPLLARWDEVMWLVVRWCGASFCGQQSAQKPLLKSLALASNPRLGLSFSQPGLILALSTPWWAHGRSMRSQPPDPRRTAVLQLPPRVTGAPKDEEDEELPDRREDMSRLHSFMAKGWPCIGLQLWAREGGAGPGAPPRAAFLPFPFLAAWQPGASSTRINKNITQFLMRTTLSVNLLANRWDLTKGELWAAWAKMATDSLNLYVNKWIHIHKTKILRRMPLENFWFP